MPRCVMCNTKIKGIAYPLPRMNGDCCRDCMILQLLVSIDNHMEILQMELTRPLLSQQEFEEKMDAFEQLLKKLQDDVKRG